jgi:hypothetical protein
MQRCVAYKRRLECKAGVVPNSFRVGLPVRPPLRLPLKLPLGLPQRLNLLPHSLYDSLRDPETCEPVPRGLLTLGLLPQHPLGTVPGTTPCRTTSFGTGL